LRLRQVSAGGCNACEADINVLGTVAFDLGRSGSRSSPHRAMRTASLITGPVTETCAAALRMTYAGGCPSPKQLVTRFGACAISARPFVGLPSAGDGAGGALPVGPVSSRDALRSTR
jgi:Ni,Fe-hydrogenase III small subunit